MPSLSKADVRDVIDVIKGLYLSDMIPWICGYSGGKDSTAVVQLVWEALSEIPANQRKKAVYVISTDTLVESPVVALWAKQSIEKMKARAQEDNLPIFPHRLTPTVNNSFWVNLIGRGYPYPRNDFRWCTDRLKIEPSNRFIKEILDSESEAILVLGTRKAESVTRKAVMEGYEKRRYRDHLSPNGSFPNSYVFTPIENWSNDNVWQFLLQYHNPWGQSNKNLMSMYSGASADGECPLVIDTSTPSCGNSRFGCWVCTMVSEDKSMAAMIRNDEEKSWMLPMLEYRNKYIGISKEADRMRRDFRKKDGSLRWYNNRLVHGPYTKETRELLLRQLLITEKKVHELCPEEIKSIPLISSEELQLIRQIWLDEKHEFDDSLPRIYEEVTGHTYSDHLISKNKYFGAAEDALLKEVCFKLFPDETLMPELQRTLLDIEAKAAAMSKKRNVIINFDGEISKAIYKNEEDAEQVAEERARRFNDYIELPAEDDLVE